MSDKSASGCCFQISAFGENGYIKVIGPGNMNIAPVMKDICYAMISENKEMIIIDLKECLIVDSTFMGTLVNINERFEIVGIEKGKLLIMNLNEDIHRLFDMVGISSMLETVPDEIDVPDLDLKLIDAGDVDREEKLRVVVEAHEKLIQLNAGNKEKFEKFLGIVKGEMLEDGIPARIKTDAEDSDSASREPEA